MDKELKAKELTEKLEELKQMTELDSLLNKNEVEFQVQSQTYRVRKPTQKEKLESNDYRMKIYFEMLNDDRYMFVEQLTEKYQQKGLSIAKIDHELIESKKIENDLLLRLAPLTNMEDINKIKVDVLDQREKQTKLQLRKAELLQYTIEYQLNDKLFSYILYLVLERKEENNWIKVFKTYQDMLNSQEEDLLLRATHFLSFLIYNNIFNYEI